jgi:hypothetical protein
MEPSFDTTSMPLDRSTFLRIVGEPGTVLSCQQGCLWITRDGSPEDIELPAGQQHLVADGVCVLVCAFEPSRVRVHRPQRSAWPRAARPAAPPLLARVAAAWRRACASPLAAAAQR